MQDREESNPFGGLLPAPPDPRDIEDRPLTLRHRGGVMTFERTRVMGALNVTPDSFSDGGRFLDPATAVEEAVRMAREGADVIDIGGESTRPGSAEVTAAEEWSRIEPVLRGLAGRLTVPLSIDTVKPEVAAKAIAAGAQMVNDVTGLRDPAMRQLVAREGVAAVIMHMQGEPRTMQENPQYEDVIDEIHEFFETRLEDCERDGIPEDRLLIDPGIGFGKTVQHNLEILKRLEEFGDLDRPILLGTSRKSFIGKLVGGEPRERLEGSLASAVFAVLAGANMVRVHDVAAHVRALRLVDAILDA
ncbi:MAG TPA: dihydropteroate synthase [Thermoplasmata archaeon]|nr:dihydropteroate synthase [Thermoplasmata archaeon]